MTNGEKDFPQTSCKDEYIKREEMLFYSKKVMDIAEDRARDSERLILLEDFCKNMSNDVSCKFESIQDKLDRLTNKFTLVKGISDWMQRSLLILLGYLLTGIATNLPQIIKWLNNLINHVKY